MYKTPGLDDIYKDLEKKLNAMQKAVPGNQPQSQYRIEADKAFPDRITIYNRDFKKRLSLNLSQVEGDHGQKVWMVGSNLGKQSKVITPHIEGMYDRQSGDISYQAFSSNQQLARILNQSFLETGKRGDVSSKFHEILSMGHQELGIKPTPSVPQGWKATQALSMGQIGLSFRSDKGFAMVDASTRLRPMDTKSAITNICKICSRS
jgi:hypothetical protein